MNKLIQLCTLVILFISCSQGDCVGPTSTSSIPTSLLTTYLPYSNGQVVKYIKNKQDTITFICSLNSFYPPYYPYKISKVSDGGCSSYTQLEERIVDLYNSFGKDSIHFTMYKQDSYSYNSDFNYKYEINFNGEKFYFTKGVTENGEITIKGITYDRIIYLYPNNADSAISNIAFKVNHGIFKIVDVHQNTYEILL